MSKINLKEYKKENRGLLKQSVDERVTYKKSGPKPKPEDEKNSAKILVSMKPAERESLEQAANGRPLSQYIKHVLREHGAI
jgi:hypothetical protein